MRFRLSPCPKAVSKAALQGSPPPGGRGGALPGLGAGALVTSRSLPRQTRLCSPHARAILNQEKNRASAHAAKLGCPAIAPHSSTLAWKIPWMEEPGRLQSMGSLRVGH